jgi:hypothetical protein
MVAPAGSSVGAYYERRGYVAVETAYQKVFAPEELHGDFQRIDGGDASGLEEESRSLRLVG